MGLRLAHADELRDVDARGEQLQVLRQLLGSEARVHDAQLREDAHVAALQPHARLQQRGDLVEVAAREVKLDDRLQLIRLHDDIEAAQLRQAELLLLHAAEAHLLPGAHRVGAPRGVHRGLELVQLDERARQAPPVGRLREKQLRRVVPLLREAAVAHGRQVRRVAAGDELLQLCQRVREGERVHELRVDARNLLHTLAHHAQVHHQLRVRALRVRRVDHQRVVVAVLRLDEARDGVAHRVLPQLRAPQRGPHLRDVHLGGVLRGARHALQVLDQHARRREVVVELAENGKRLLVQLAAHSDVAHRGAIEVVQPVDVVRHAARVRLDGRQDEQVLQVRVVAKRAVLQHDLLQQLDQLVRQVRRHERLDRHAHLLRVLALWQRGGHNLVDQLLAARVVRAQHVRPQRRVHALHHVARLQLEQAVAGGDVAELDVAAPLFVRHARQVGVALLAVAAQHQRLVVLVGQQEVLRVVVAVDDDLAHRVVHRRVRAPLVHQVLQEGVQHLQPVARLHLVHQRAHGQQGAHGEDERLDEALLRLRVQQRAHNLGRLLRVHLLHVALDVAQHVVIQQVDGQVVHHVAVLRRLAVEAVAHVDERPRVRQLGLHEEHLGALRVVAVALARHALHLLDLPRARRRLDVLEVHLRVLALRDVGAQVEEEALPGLEGLEQLDDLLRRQLLRVLLGHLDDELQVLPHVHRQQLAQALERPVARQRAEELDERGGLDGVRVHDDALDVRQVRVVLQRARVQPRLLAQLRHARLVVVRKHVVGQDGVRHVGERHQVHLQHFRLQRRLLRQVGLQHV